MNKVTIFDTTLRDGSQAEGMAFSVNDKLHILKILDDLGVSFIEAGNPFFNPKETEFFKACQNIVLKNATLVAFCSTRRKDTACEMDEGLNAALSANTDAVSIFGKCWDMQVSEILNVSNEENLQMIYESISYLKESGKYIIFDAEHFFDGYKSNKDYAMDTLRIAQKAGADVLCLCDTNGGCFTYEIEKIVACVSKKFPDISIGIHCHNDIGCAVSNSIAAVLAGAVHVQGTYLGFGERCGNANLSTIIPSLQLKLGYECINSDKISSITNAANSIAEILNTSVKKFQPYIGSSAFAHKAGMHADGVMKTPKSFEHIDPELVGNERKILMSEMTGTAAVFKKISEIIPTISLESEEAKDILAKLKALEKDGYQFEGADGSFKMLVLKTLGLFKSSFSLVSYKVLDELPYDNSHTATATIKVKVDGKLQISAAEGDGPINALDRALREALSVFYPVLAGMHLVDYKVRVIDSGRASAARVRVLITSTDGVKTWSTVGVSKDIIEASWFAIVDSIEYKLSNTASK